MISLPQEQFRKAALFAASFASRRSVIPVLSTVKVTANGALSFEGTDLDSYARATVPYDGEEGEFLLPEPRKVATALRNSGGETVAFEQREKKLRMEAGELVADLSSTQHPDDFPNIELIAEETFGATVGEEFFRQLDRVRPAISTEETRYYLNGICARKVDDWLYRFVATDGHRLFIADVPLPDATGEMPEDIIIPRRAVERAIANFAKAKDGARFSLGRTVKTNRKDKTLAAASNKPPRAGFSGEIDGVRLELATKLIDGTYPDVSRVIPSEHPFSIRMKRAGLLKALRCITPLSTDKTREIKIGAEPGRVTLSLRSPDSGDSRFPVPAEHQAPAGFEIGMNARYLLDALNALTGEEVDFGLTDPGAPVTITDPADLTFKIVQMPMQV